MVDSKDIRAKFGDDFVANDRTFVLGIDHRLTRNLAERFRGRTVLETCTGAGFTTMALAREATHVVTIEIDLGHQEQARRNLAAAGLLDRVTLVAGDAMDRNVLSGCPPINAALLDPDWAVTGPDHVYRFRRSNMRPPADELLGRAFELTPHVGLILPPLVDVREFDGLPAHERQELHLDGSHELSCLYFGDIARTRSVTVLRR